MHLDKSADLLVDEDLLLLAARKGHLVSVHELIEEGMNVNVSDDTGRTPLIHAAEKGHVEVVRELLDAGADIWSLTRNGMTADILAASEEVRQILREAMATRSKG